MSVDADTVRRVAHLARIAVADDEVGSLQGELNAILTFVEQLGEGKLSSSIPPLTRRAMSSGTSPRQFSNTLPFRSNMPW